MIATAIAGLNLGSRNRSIPDFLNMDIDQHDGVDIVGDISDLSRFEDNSIPVIYASHVLEHVGFHKTIPTLREWYRVLRPGGILYLAVPDFARCVELYQTFGLSDWHVRYLMGDQLYKTAYHHDLFDEPRLARILGEVGFSEYQRVEAFPLGDPGDCSNGKSTFDDKPVSLNLVVTK